MAPSKNQAATWYRKPQTRGTSSTQQKAAVKDEAKSQTKVDPDSAKATKPEVELPRDRSKVRFGLCLIRKNPQPHTVSSLERKRQRLVAEHFLNMLEVKKGRLKETDDDLAAAQSRRMQLEKEEQKLKTKLDDAQRNYDNHPLAWMRSIRIIST